MQMPGSKMGGGAPVQGPRYTKADDADKRTDIAFDNHFAERYDLAKACQDFLRSDHNGQENRMAQVQSSFVSQLGGDGTAIPVTNGKISRVGNQSTFSGQLDLGPYGLRPDMFISTCDYGDDLFVRISS